MLLNIIEILSGITKCLWAPEHHLVGNRDIGCQIIIIGLGNLQDL